MRYERLRDTPTSDELAAMYAEPHDHRRWGYGHAARVQRTIELAREYVPLPLWPCVVADLSCGNAAIAHGIARADDSVLLGDYAPGYAIHGPIERTVKMIGRVDVFICCETLEHIEDPVAVLTEIHPKTTFLVASTPIDNWGDSNGEHLHSWDREHVEEILRVSGFVIVAFDNVDASQWDESYNYGIWICS